MFLTKDFRREVRNRFINSYPTHNFYKKTVVDARKGSDSMSEQEKAILEKAKKIVPKLSEKKKERLLNVMDGIALMCDDTELENEKVEKK